MDLIVINCSLLLLLVYTGWFKHPVNYLKHLIKY